eukprot:745675-Hanusia_phi.AAC.2
MAGLQACLTELQMWDAALKGCQDLSLWCSVVDSLRACRSPHCSLGMSNLLCRRVGQARTFFKRGLNTLQSAQDLASFCYRSGMMAREEVTAGADGWSLRKGKETWRRWGKLAPNTRRLRLSILKSLSVKIFIGLSPDPLLIRLLPDDKVGRAAKKPREKKSDDPERAKRREEVTLSPSYVPFPTSPFASVILLPPLSSHSVHPSPFLHSLLFLSTACV